MELNLKDVRPRMVVYVNQSSDDPLLLHGQLYHMERLVVYGCHSEVFLKEFPGEPFNSTYFAERGSYDVPVIKVPQRLEKFFNEHYHFIKLCYQGETLPTHLTCLNGGGEIFGLTVDLRQLKKKLNSLKSGETYIIGRKSSHVDVDLSISENIGISRVHCYITKENGIFSIYDASKTGVALKFTKTWRENLKDKFSKLLWA